MASAALIATPANADSQTAAEAAADKIVSAVKAATPANVKITLDISNIRSAKGNVLVCLSANPKYFPDCRKDKKARKFKVAADKAGTFQINDVTPGTYAIALVHDENANDKMDLALFLPKEGFGFSRNPKIGMGPPKFKSAQFTVGADDVSYAVKMKYIL